MSIACAVKRSAPHFCDRCAALRLIREHLVERQTITYEHKQFPTSFYQIKDREELYWSAARRDAAFTLEP